MTWATGVDPTNGYEPSADAEEDVNRLLAAIPHIRVSEAQMRFLRVLSSFIHSVYVVLHMCSKASRLWTASCC